MRLAPVPLFFYPDRDAAILMSGESARTTHGAIECVEASRLFGAILVQALAGATKEGVLLGHGIRDIVSPGLQAIAAGQYRSKTEQDIRGSGYVVESLEAALWCFATTASFSGAVLAAANLGQDADTTAAICGQIAGAYYGVEGIPQQWIAKVSMRETIKSFADSLLQVGQATAVEALES